MIVDSARETWDSVKAIASGDFGPADLGNVAIAILSIPSGGEAAAARPALTTLFRAVSPAEFRQVMRTGAFEAGANSLGGKWLAESRGDAVKWGETMSRGESFRVLQIEMPTSQANELMRVERLDNIGPARYGELDQLSSAKITEARNPR